MVNLPRKSSSSRWSLLPGLLLLLWPALMVAQPKISVTQTSGGVLVRTATEMIHITVCGPASVHIVAAPNTEDGGNVTAGTPKEPRMVQPCTRAPFTLHVPVGTQAPSSPGQASKPLAATLDTGRIRVLISLDYGSLAFQDEQGNQLLREFEDEPRTYRPVTRNGEAMYGVEDRFYLAAWEGLYGLGQHQNGVFNYRGTVIELGQANTDIDIPLLVSTKGYGIFWNSAAISYFDNRFAHEMRLTSDVANAVDYYFLYGPEDQIIHQYRQMTGQSLIHNPKIFRR